MHAYARFAGKDIVHCTCAIGTVTVLEPMAARGREKGSLLVLLVLTHFMVCMSRWCSFPEKLKVDV